MQNGDQIEFLKVLKKEIKRIKTQEWSSRMILFGGSQC